MVFFNFEIVLDIEKASRIVGEQVVKIDTFNNIRIETKDKVYTYNNDSLILDEKDLERVWEDRGNWTVRNK